MHGPQSEHRSPQGPIAWCLLSALLFGASTPIAKALLAHVGPVLLSGLLYAGAAIAVAPWALRDLRARRAIKPVDARRLFGAVVFGGVVGPVLLLNGLSRTSAGSTALWLNLETVATAVLARVFFKEHLGPRSWLAVALILVASALLSPGSASAGYGVLLIALACVAWALDNNLTSLIDQFTPAQITFAKGLAAACVNLSAGLLFEPQSPTGFESVAALTVGALSYGASLMLYVAGAQQLGATRSQLLFSTAPAWGLLLAWAVLGEPLRTQQLSAACLMALALWLWHRERHTHLHAHPRLTHEHWHRHDDNHHQHAHESGSSTGTQWHCHQHTHEPIEHAHPHRPDLHHRHEHR